MQKHGQSAKVEHRADARNNRHDQVAVGAGNYTSPSEVVRDALRVRKMRRAGRELEIGGLRAKLRRQAGDK